MGIETGIALPYAAAPVEEDALATLRPLSVGANPIKFEAMAPWSVPEVKPYIAEGIAKAMTTIGEGIKARYQRKRDDAKDAFAERKMKLEEDRLQKEKDHNVQMHSETMARIEGTQSTKSAKDESKANEALRNAEAESPMGGSGETGGGVDSKDKTSEILPFNKDAIAAYENRPITIPTYSPTLTPEEQKAAKAEEDKIVSQAGLRGIPAPVPSVEKPKTQPKKDDLLTLGTPAEDKEKSLIATVKEAAANPPALSGLGIGSLGEPLLVAKDSGTGALAKTQAIQDVNPKDIRTKFGDYPKLAYEQARIFNETYPFAAIRAEVKEPSKSVPYWHVDYPDVSKERRGELRTIEEHAETQKLKQQRLDIFREAKVMAMANNYEKHPTSKLMDTRKDAMQRMLVAIQEDEHARKSNDAASLSLIHQEMMDLFAQFASGKAPTEAQFSEVKHGFSGLSGWQSVAKKVQFWKSGAKLDERDVRTMQNLMLNTYNTSAGQVNSQLATIESILKSENPKISPMKLPVQYPLLKTKEFLKEQLGGKDPDQALTEYAKLRGEYFDDATGTFKKEMSQNKRKQYLELKPIAEEYSALKNNNFIPPNLDELKHPKKEMFGPHTYFKVPGFHSSYFSAPPVSSLAAEGHYQGSAE